MGNARAEDLWQRLETLLPHVERPARYIDSEWAVQRDEAAEYRAALVYPDTYELGMANQAIAILYRRLNAMPGVAAERCYVPWEDMAEAMRREQLPLYTLETLTPLAACDLIGITLPYELTYTNVLEVLDLAGVPLRAVDRTDVHPIVLGGGPCSYNPEPVAPFFDAILIGEGEEAVVEIVEAHRAALANGNSRAQVLRALADVPGVYVPSAYERIHAEDGRLLEIRPLDGAPQTVVKRALASLDVQEAVTCPVVPFMDVVHDRANVEVQRGCTRGCRFCQAGMIYRPVRERSADTVVRDAVAALTCTGYEELSLTSLSSADHSQIEEILRRLSRRLEGTGVAVSLPSLRVDSFSVGLARLVSSSGRKVGLTFAPEAGTQRLRDVINKNVAESDLIETVRTAFEAGWRRVKLYFMIGLPTETDEDIVGIGRLVNEVVRVAREVTPPAERGGLKIGVSVSTFVPKSHTPFQWDAQIPLAEVERRQTVLRGAMPRRLVDLSWHDADVSFLEGVMARGGREIADVIETAWRSGARFDAWTERFSLPMWFAAFETCGVDPTGVANRERPADEILPWSHISCGVSARYLERERERAIAGTPTPDCSFEGCTGCRVCDDLGLAIDLGGEARG